MSDQPHAREAVIIARLLGADVAEVYPLGAVFAWGKRKQCLHANSPLWGTLVRLAEARQ
jgi:hypothetical protein